MQLVSMEPEAVLLWDHCCTVPSKVSIVVIGLLLSHDVLNIRLRGSYMVYLGLEVVSMVLM